MNIFVTALVDGAAPEKYQDAQKATCTQAYPQNNKLLGLAVIISAVYDAVVGHNQRQHFITVDQREGESKI